MDPRGVQAGGVDRPVDQGGEVARDGPVAPLDEQPLGVQPPEHVVVLQRRDEPLRVVLRQLRPVARLAVLRDDPIDPPVRLVAQRGLIRRALAGLVALGRRVVLHDEVVPVDHPDLPVRADLGQDRRGPLVVARHEVPGVVRVEVGAVRVERERRDEVPGRLGDEGRLVPVVLRIGARRVERRAGPGREPAVPVDLADVLGDREEAVRVGDVLQDRRRHAADRLVVSVRDRHVDARAAVGGRAEEEALLADADAPRVVVRAAEELQLRAVRLEPEEPLAEAVPLAADLAAEAGVADDRVDPVIQPVAEVRRAGVGVVRAEAGEEDLPLVGLAVAVGVLEEEHVGGLRHDQAAVDVAEARRDAQVVGEERDLVGLAVAVGVLDDRDPVAPLALRLHLVGVVDRLGDVQPAEVVPGHRDRLVDLRLGDEQLRLEPGRQGEVLLRLVGRERLLHPADRLAEGAPPGAGGVQRDLGRLVLERLQALRHARPGVVDVPLVRGPADAPLEEVMEAGVAPGAGVVAVRGVEDAPLAVRAGPGPGLGAGLVVAGLEDVAVLRVVLGVDVGLVPGAEGLQPLDDRMVGVDDRRLELAGAVLLELGADQRDVLGGVQEAERGAVQRDEAAAARHVVEQRLLLVLADPGRIGVDEQRVILAERLGVQVRHLLGVGDLDPASGQHRGDLRVAIGGAVVPLVAEEEDR